MEWPISWNDVKKEIEKLSSGCGLPVITLTTEIPDTYTGPLNETDSALLTEAISAKTVVMCTMTAGAITTTGILIRADQSGTIAWIMDTGMKGKVGFMPPGTAATDAWYVMPMSES